MSKIFAGVTLSLLAVVFAFQVQGVNAKQGENNGKKPLTSPISSPCKPGNGYGDKNHCHFGAPGQIQSQSVASKSGR